MAHLYSPDYQAGYNAGRATQAAQIEAQDARIAELTAALNPFSQYGEILNGQRASDETVVVELWSVKITVGDLRKARAALAAVGEKHD